MVSSQLDAIYLFWCNIYFMCNLNIIEIYVYLNKLGSIACYLAHKFIKDSVYYCFCLAQIHEN